MEDVVRMLLTNKGAYTQGHRVPGFSLLKVRKHKQAWSQFEEISPPSNWQFEAMRN